MANMLTRQCSDGHTHQTMALYLVAIKHNFGVRVNSRIHSKNKLKNLTLTRSGNDFTLNA